MSMVHSYGKTSGKSKKTEFQGNSVFLPLLEKGYLKGKKIEFQQLFLVQNAIN